MTDLPPSAPDILDQIGGLRAAGQPFAVATVVRTVAVTAAKAGAKAVIHPDGTISAGWIGGGCARGAVLRAAAEALADGTPRLISVQPEEALGAQGIRPGETRDGIRFARNGCPSRGTMDIFVEPVLPRPECLILGHSPVGAALADLAPRLGFAVRSCPGPADLPPDPAPGGAQTYLVVATQGRGDSEALRAALAHPAAYRAFVGSRAKVAHLMQGLGGSQGGAGGAGICHAPAGLDIGAITPEEIALSILAQMVAHRRKGQRHGDAPAA